ncbi:hypothetical protein COEREDRAFT_85797 [Coemansia reversa NRRL 1564]|uniref:Uncharacterized protein n=1 Tax=Coemansia reversa (strain ATCC 12441 / NRRL 1564) TaxID=763665 RepID=A0A2G5BG15_COERN|nr:hypothetical protein COEREDRAFT_85797 [Coemansia reversa NRRL 1564]|eukprot:PIA17922.1 hypothetical protein COEREDRAFT_85797 [Coemansia reversa NRRL 1564]
MTLNAPLSASSGLSTVDTEGEGSDKEDFSFTADKASGNHIETTETANPTSDKCPVKGATSVESMRGCNSVGYTLCVNGKWPVYPYFSGTSCYLQGHTAICDWEREYDKDSCNTQSIFSKSRVNMLSKLQSDLRPISAFTANEINSRIEYIPLSVLRGQFSALVKLQTLHAPLGNNWMLSFQLPHGQSIDNVDSGRICS